MLEIRIPCLQEWTWLKRTSPFKSKSEEKQFWPKRMIIMRSNLVPCSKNESHCNRRILHLPSFWCATSKRIDCNKPVGKTAWEVRCKSSFLSEKHRLSGPFLVEEILRDIILTTRRQLKSIIILTALTTMKNSSEKSRRSSDTCRTRRVSKMIANFPALIEATIAFISRVNIIRQLAVPWCGKVRIYWLSVNLRRRSMLIRFRVQSSFWWCFECVLVHDHKSPYDWSHE